MSHTLEMTLEREENEEAIDIAITVEFEYTGPHRGYRDSMGVPEEPDDEAEIEILSITDEDEKVVKTTEKEDEIITQACFDSLD